MRPSDRAQALEIVALLAREADDGYGHVHPVCMPHNCRGMLLRKSADTITFLLAHIDALTPMARAWANGDTSAAAGMSSVTVMDPAEDC